MDEGQTASSTAFPIVGVGASAGGLAATVELLRHLGSKPGIAIVIVHHLDPTRESSLVEIFARATQLPVQVARGGLRVEPNQVYVVPPNAELLISAGALKLAPRAGTGGLHLPIDRFFESLASDCTFHAVGVLLSGTGSDGTHGIKAIKAEGGVTFAQDASAEYRGMPDSAIATGCVDFVLPLAAIARALLRIGEHAVPLSVTMDSASAETDFARIVAALRKATGVDFTHYKHTTVRRRVQRRALVHGLTSLCDYAELIENSSEEARALCEDVLIHVTSFFRDPETFEVLKTLAFPKIVEKRPRDLGIRIWVPGCSTGEEVYSIAISLLEFLTDANAGGIPIKLFGTDISLGAIEKARAGKYPTSIERDVSQGRLQRFFLKQDGFYQIRKDVRDLCVFAKHDATRDPPFSGMDLVSCRNLMIYLDLPLQDRILPVLHYALKEPGFLVLGSSETVRSFPGFAVLDTKNKIYARTSAAPRRLLDFGVPRLLQQVSGSTLSAARPSGATDVHREADRIVLAEFGPPGVVVTDDLAIVQFRGKTGPFLEPAPGVASFDLLRMVKEELRLPLRQALDEARTKQSPVKEPGLPIGTGAGLRTIEIEVVPFGLASTTQRFFLVLFSQLAPAPDSATASASGEPRADVVDASAEAGLRQELASTRNYLQSVIEQLEASNEELKAANEEIVSSNEELLSTNEELQMAKEELEATNEELRTVNEEMNVRNIEGARLNDDLGNVLSSVEIPIVILGRDSRLRRFTPAAGKALGLVAGDVGRPFAEIKPVIRTPDLPQMIADVLARLSIMSRTVRSEDGRFHQLTVRPYLTADGRIDGTVITLFDIDEVKQEELINQARLYDAKRAEVAAQQSELGFREMLTTATEPIVMTGASGKIVFANRAAAGTFGYADNELLGQSVDVLVPERLRARHAQHHAQYLAKPSPRPMARGLDIVGRRKDGTEFPVEITLSTMGKDSAPLVMSFITDITLQRATEKKIGEYQDKLQRMAFDAALTEERERRQIAADLHDRIGQSLALAQIKLSSARQTAGRNNASAIDEAIELLAQSIADTRTLTFELSPPVLYELGLKEALSWLAEDVQKRHGIRVELDDDELDKPLDDATAALVFRAVRELLMNVFKHAETPTAKVSLRRTDETFDIEVEDHGVGFDPEAVAPRATTGGFGLFSVKEQIGRLGGTADIVSSPQAGTRISIRVPLKRVEPSTPIEPERPA